MLEALRQRFVPDRLLRRIPERGARECSPEVYLEGLTEQNRQQVVQFVKFTQSLREKLPGVRIGVIAIGSTTRPKSDRHHPAEDIDLRILNSAPINSEQQKVAIGHIINATRDYLRQEGVEFEEANHTVETRMVWGYSGDKKELMPYVDWYNTNPSFVTKPKVGLPLHISISGTDAWDLETHLAEEKKHGGSFSVLMENK
ncbi:MAG: hypothetical protein AAB609_02735 [Patescibacteria group bacterium]